MQSAEIPNKNQVPMTGLATPFLKPSRCNRFSIYVSPVVQLINCITAITYEAMQSKPPE